MTKTVSVYKTVMKREEEPIEVDRDDLVSVSDAADLRGVKIPTIVYLMNTGDLPTFQFMTDPSGEKRIPKYTSRKALEALPKAKGEQGRLEKAKRFGKNVYSRQTPALLPLKRAVTSIFSPRRAFAFQ
jgi:hypothetical protein